MREFRYEAIDADGHAIHGIQVAEDQDALLEILKRRGHEVVSVTAVEIPVHSDDLQQAPARMTQLRITDAVQTALLTKLPTDVVLRAAAREPVWSPVAAMLPWVQITVLILLAVTAVHAGMAGAVTSPLYAAGILAVLCWGPGWLLAHQLEQRPGRLMLRMADNVSSGQAELETMSKLLPGRLGEIARSDLPEDRKMLVISELLSGTSGAGMARNRLFLNLMGPILLLSASAGVCYAFVAMVVPGFREIFEGFSLDLPGITQLLIAVSTSFEMIGIPGAAAILVAGLGSVVGLFFVVHRGWLNEQLESVPLLGTGLRWLSLAGVARWLAALLRNGAAPDESLRVAVRQSYSEHIRRDGAQLADLMSEGRAPSKARTSLSGLPVSLLFGLGGESADERRRSALASTLDGLASMFERAVFSSGRIVASVIQLVILAAVACVVGLIVVALFLPLVTLLDALT